MKFISKITLNKGQIFYGEFKAKSLTNDSMNKNTVYWYIETNLDL